MLKHKQQRGLLKLRKNMRKESGNKQKRGLLNLLKNTEKETGKMLKHKQQEGET